MRSSIVARIRPRCTLRPSAPAATGPWLSATTALASVRNITRRSLRYFSGFTIRRNIQGAELVWLSAGASLSVTVAGSGWSPTPGREAFFILRYRKEEDPLYDPITQSDSSGGNPVG